MSISAAQILSQNTHRIPGKLQVTEYFFRVPLDHARPNGEKLRLFARGVTKAESPTSTKPSTPGPWLTYFQGGPGFGCSPPSAGGWIGAALDAGYRVLLLDGRGTGLSQPVTPEKLASIARETSGSDSAAGSGPTTAALKAQADYLRHFRAPGIVADAEAVRRALAVAEGADETRKWSILGQSFGGFCVTHYLSRFPEGLNEAFTTGGLPPLGIHPDKIYGRLVHRWIARSKQFYEKFPEDVARVQKIAKYLKENDVRTLGGGKITVSRLQGMGINMGFHGGIQRIHNFIMRAAADLEYDRELSSPTISDAGRLGGDFDHAIIYALLHEPAYQEGSAANWSAERVIAATPELQIDTASESPIYFTAEAITQSVFDDYPLLRSLKPLADHFAQTSDWEQLYDLQQLAKNTVPVYAATFVDDQYVDFDLAQDTASKIKNCKVWLSNTVYHDGIRSKADEVMRNLIAMRDDVLD